MNASDRGKQHRNHDHRRGHGSILKGDRAMRARELVEQPEPSGESQMPEPGQEWKTIPVSYTHLTLPTTPYV